MEIVYVWRNCLYFTKHTIAESCIVAKLAGWWKAEDAVTAEYYYFKLQIFVYKQIL